MWDLKKDSDPRCTSDDGELIFAKSRRGRARQRRLSRLKSAEKLLAVLKFNARFHNCSQQIFISTSKINEYRVPTFLLFHTLNSGSGISFVKSFKQWTFYFHSSCSRRNNICRYHLIFKTYHLTNKIGCL